MDMNKLVILVDPGAVNLNDLYHSKNLKGATLLRARKAKWGLMDMPISFYYVDSQEPLNKVDIDYLRDNLDKFVKVGTIGAMAV